MKYVTLLMLLLLSMSVSADDDREAVGNVLDALHTNASNADFDSYFGLYDDNAVFIGTDASEVWNLTTFMAYAKPHFDKGSGWTYSPRDRHIYFSPDKKVAWFDELLDNEKLGETRGTGVLIKQDGKWKVTQYHLAIPIPNTIADAVAEQIKAIDN